MLHKPVVFFDMDDDVIVNSEAFLMFVPKKVLLSWSMIKHQNERIIHEQSFEL